VKIQRKFMWGWGREERKISWISWDKICKAKENDGLGVRDLRSFNVALLGKWLWRFHYKKIWYYIQHQFICKTLNSYVKHSFIQNTYGKKFVCKTVIGNCYIQIHNSYVTKDGYIRIKLSFRITYEYFHM